MSNYKLLVKKYRQQGHITWEYNPLRNLKTRDGQIKGFRVKNSNAGFNFNLENPVDIECQPSYDGTVNLIINDDANPPKIVNSRWTATENNTYKIINREQINQSNLYRADLIDRETRLFRNIDGVTKIDLYNVGYFGKLKAGNYIFYMKYMDDDYNETDIVAQSGVISIFNGTITNPATISGGIQDEETDKSISLKFRDLDTSFTYFKLYVYRTTCDSNGVKLDHAYKIDTDYEIKDSTSLIHINGFEDIIDISIEELNIQYHTVDSVKSQAQVQNMLFFANVSKPKSYDPEIQDLSLYIKAKEYIDETGIGYIDTLNYKKQRKDDVNQVEYYSPTNIYYKLGYWPDELYRFGIVYIYNDDHLSPVYNLRGCNFDKAESNIDANSPYKIYTGSLSSDNKNRIPISQEWMDHSGEMYNTRGVFKFNRAKFEDIMKDKSGINNIRPLGIQFTFDPLMIHDLHNKNIKGFFFVRQQRIPTVLCQGFSVGVDKAGYFPMLKEIKINDKTQKDEGKYIVESFKNKDQLLTTSINDRLLETDKIQSSGLLSVDSYLNRGLQSFFDTSEFVLEKIIKYTNQEKINNGKHYCMTESEYGNGYTTTTNLVYIDQEVPQKIYQDMGFSTKAGMQEDLRYNAYFVKADPKGKNPDLVRGLFTSFIGTTSTLDPNCVYNIRIKNYNSAFLKEYFEIRMNDNSPYYATSERYCISPKVDAVDYNKFHDYAYKEYSLSDGNVIWDGKEGDTNINFNVFRGDCFTATATTRMQRNFTSASVPINDIIIQDDTWKKNFKGVRYTTDWDKMNKADVDAVPIGHWVTYKFFSNYNIGLRCIDPYQIEEQALMGNPRGFYPLQGISVKSSNKIPESNLMNQGYSSLLGVQRNFTQSTVPYTKDIFDTRIMFSNIQVDGEFKNSYKVFQGLSYEDIDRQYGSITKIIPWGVNLFCVFEHGLAIVPVNEKALLQTNTGANIHMYGAGVLQKQVVLISDSVGSTWKDSIIKTPVAIYGVDTSSHKIWRYSNELKLEILSDFKMQRFLHDNIDLKEMDKYTILGVRNVKSHYNAFKSDVMFTYYNDDNVWNICYNEVLGKWTTRYSWTPFLSENVDYSMFSYDLMKTRILGILNTNLGRVKDKDYVTVNYPNTEPGVIHSADKNIPFEMNVNSTYSGYNINSISVLAYHWDNELNKSVSTEVSRIDWNTAGNIINQFGNYISHNVKNIDLTVDDTLDDRGNIKISKSEKMYNQYVGFLDNDKKLHHDLSFNTDDDLKNLYYKIDVEYCPYYVATVVDDVENNNNSSIILSNENKKYSIGLIKDFNDFYNTNETSDPQDNENYKNALISSLFVHGRSLNADEINYKDYKLDNQCLPTKWYDKQEPFEFEVVINEPKGAHKIFDNLMIISNNVEPDSLEIEITGDAYTFDKEGIFKYDNKLSDNIANDYFAPVGKNKEGNDVYKTEVKYDTVENSYSLLVHQDLLNIKEYGRRLGNIIYNEDKWYITLSPIYYKTKYNELRSTKIRDKYAKVRVKYKGDKLVVLVALQTVMTLSFV